MLVLIKSGCISAGGTLCTAGEVVEVSDAMGARLTASGKAQEVLVDVPAPVEAKQPAPVKKRATRKAKKQAASGLPAPDMAAAVKK